jgi:osmotically-inducible protein OsmY
VSDSAISAAVKSRFNANAVLKPLNLTVDTHDGVVTLRGQVTSVGQRNVAQAEARVVKGVKAVKNELTLK